MIASPRGLVLGGVVAALYGWAFLGLLMETPVKAEADQHFPPGSSLRRASGGAALAASYLEARGQRVSRLTDSDAARLPRSAVVFVLNPPTSPGSPEVRPLLTEVEQRFLEGGGRIVLTLGGSVPSIQSTPAPASSRWERVHPLLPEGEITLALKTNALSGPWLQQAHALFVSGESVVAARRVYGKGDLIVIGSPEAFTNERLARGETLRWLDALAHGRDVYFDETVHGVFETKGVFDLLGEWGLMPAFAALLLFAAAWAARAASSFGPPERHARVNYADGIDLLDALGTLYARSVSEEEAVARYARSGTRGIASWTATRPASGPPLPSLADRLREVGIAQRRPAPK